MYEAAGAPHSKLTLLPRIGANGITLRLKIGCCTVQYYGMDQGTVYHEQYKCQSASKHLARLLETLHAIREITVPPWARSPHLSLAGSATQATSSRTISDRDASPTLARLSGAEGDFGDHGERCRRSGITGQ
jgi:hypothetical protein